MPKLPLPPAHLARDIGVRDEELREITPELLLWRVHRVRGGHVTPWNELRHFGPVDARFEPHPLQPGPHAKRAVWHAAATPQTALAEVFQRTRTVPLADSYHLTSAKLCRTVRLLDITGAGVALSTGRRDYTSAWARALCDEFPDMDGLVYRAAVEGGLAVALFMPAAGAMPRQAATSRALSDPALAARIAGVCHTIGYRIAGPAT